MPPVEPQARQQLLAIMRDNSDALMADVFARVFAEHPEARAMFPANMTGHRRTVLGALTHVLGSFGDPQREAAMLEFLGQLGKDHRQYGLTPELYRSFATSLARALLRYAEDSRTPALDDAIRVLARTAPELMNAGAQSIHGTAFTEATVLEHIRVTRGQAVVRLQADAPVPYAAGQYLNVRAGTRPWRFLSPTIPPDPSGLIEFHIRAVPGGDVSGSIVTGTRPGDRWRLGAANGAMTVDRRAGTDVLMIGGGSGIAPLRALLLDMARFGDNPRVHLFYGARYPGELIEMPTLWRLSHTNPWLTVVPVSEEDDDPWWLPFGGELHEPGMHVRQTGTLGDVVASYGAWGDRQVLVCGSPSMVDGTIGTITAAGTPRAHIVTDPR